MPLPSNFNESEHLQDLFRRYANEQVRNFFRDLGGDNWDPDINTSRGSLRHGCTHKDDDSLPMTLLRWELFNYARRLKFDVPMYGIPISSFDAERKYKPQIVLNFMEDIQDVDFGFDAITGRISFRLMEHTAETITPAIAKTYATKIKTEFCANGGFVWRKGKIMSSYTDWNRGYQFQVLCRTKADARAVIEKVLEIKNDVFELSRFNCNENQAAAEAYPTVPPNERVYGETRRGSRKRPIADVRFQYATLQISELGNAIPLVDRTALYPSALVD